MYGVKSSEDLLFQKQFSIWQQQARTSVYLATENTPEGKWHKGYVTELIAKLTIAQPDQAIVMMCGPELMMKVAAQELIKRRIKPENLFVSLERNMQCGIGHCGHCQCVSKFVCKDGPVFVYDEHLLNTII